MNYCVEVVDKTLQERRKVIEGTDPNLDAEPLVRSKLYTEEVLVRLAFRPMHVFVLNAHSTQRNQINNELTVERIIRQRSLEGIPEKPPASTPPKADDGLATTVFKSRCKFFEPPQSDAEARQWWDGVHRER